MGWLIRDEKNNPISNFRPKVLSLIKKHANERAKHDPWVEVELSFARGIPSEKFTIPVKDLEKVDWLSKDQRCRLYPEISPAKAQRYIADEVRKVFPDFKGKEKDLHLVSRLGTQIIEGIPTFCTGDRLICSPVNREIPKVEIAPMPYRLAIDPNINEHEALVGIFDLMSLSPDPLRVVLSQKLLYIMRHVYETVWKSPCVIVFLHGHTGTRKRLLLHC